MEMAPSRRKKLFVFMLFVFCAILVVEIVFLAGKKKKEAEEKAAAEAEYALHGNIEEYSALFTPEQEDEIMRRSYEIMKAKERGEEVTDSFEPPE